MNKIMPAGKFYPYFLHCEKEPHGASFKHACHVDDNSNNPPYEIDNKFDFVSIDGNIEVLSAPMYARYALARKIPCEISRDRTMLECKEG